MAGREALQPILSPSFRRLQFANRSPKTRLPPSLFLSTMVSSDSIDGGSSVADGIRLLLFRVKKLSHNAVLPSRASPLSAGYDLSSAAAVVVPARGKALVPTDLSIAIPDGTYARIAPRSGLAWKYSIDVGAGVVDADYRGPVGVILFNHSDADFEVKPGDRIAQLILERIMTPEVIEALTWAPLPGATADSNPQVCDVIKLGLHSLFIMLRNSVSAT